MIKFSLSCENDHRFDSWFASSDAFEKLQAGHMVSCMHCGSTQIKKSLMAPAVAVSQPTGDLHTPSSDAETALAQMRRQIEENADYVGLSFAAEARAMHDGTTPERPIYGEANLKEAKSLIEDGIPVAPLPFTPKRKTN